MRKTMFSLVAVCDMYTKIRTKRPNWFWACPGLDPEDYLGFQKWVYDRFPYWYEDEDHVVVTKPSGSTIEAHVAFLGRIDMDALRDVLDQLFESGAHRVEVPVVVKTGRTIRRVLKGLGFQMEGILRERNKYFDPQLGQNVFLDVEMWAKLSSEETNNG